MGIDMEDISVHFVDFHGSGIDEQVILNQDGSYTILIDARASYEAQAAAYEHAMSHIRNGDFQKDDVQQIESSAHRKSNDAPKAVKVVSFHNHKRKRMKQASKSDLKKVAQEIEFLQNIAVASGLDYNDLILRRAEKRMLYGDL